MRRLILINPNTNETTTETMRAIAARAAPDGWSVSAMTVRRGVPLITDAVQLAQAAAAVANLADAPELDDSAAAGMAGVIVSAFGDPGLDALRARLSVPVTGIGEAAFAEAAAGGRRFAVATTTPDLAEPIAAMARRRGHGASFAGVALTEGDVHRIMADPARLVAALGEACERAIADLGAEAIVIGGGPLGEAAAMLTGRFAVPIIAPIPAAVRLAIRRIGGEAA